MAKDKENNNEGIIQALNALLASEGWGIVCRIIEDNIRYLEAAILDKRDPDTKNQLSDEAVEQLRYKRFLNIEIKDTPQNYIKILQEKGEEPKNYDPYFRTKEEFIKANRP